MKILVIGGTSGIGRLVVDEAAGRGHLARAMGRSAGKLEGAGDGIEPFVGNALDPDDVRRALAGVDAVVQALGIKESVSMLWEEVTLFSEATEALLPAMKETGVSRLLAVTGFGAGRSREAMSSVEKLGHGIVLGKPYEDKTRQEALIMESDVDWTIVRPVILTNGEPKGYRVLAEPESWRNGTIPRAAVAAFIVDEAERGEYVRRDVVLAR